jgi:hypothetical protein
MSTATLSPQANVFFEGGASARWIISRREDLNWFTRLGAGGLPQALFPSQAVQGAALGIAFTHYMMDARIWHVRSEQELATALRTRFRCHC